MNMEGENIYKKGEAVQEEKKRLEHFSYPFQVSREIIGQDIKEKNILDIGSGPNTELGLWVREKGGHYIAFDFNKQFLYTQSEKDNLVTQGDVEYLPFKPESVDITHTRFALVHMPLEKRTDVIKKILETTREKAVFLEFDWNTFKSGSAVTVFRDFAFDFLKEKSNPFSGDDLLKEVKVAVSENEERVNEVIEKRFNRESGEYYNEIIPIMNTIVGIMKKMEHKKFGKAEEILKMLETEAKKDNPEKFTPPDIVAVEVTF